MCNDPQLPQRLAKMRQKQDGSKEDDRLYQLIENFCQQCSNKIKRSKAFSPLLAEIQKLPGLAKPSYPHPDYSDILQETWFQVSQKICTEFEPMGKSLRSSLVLWINEKLQLKYKVIGLFSTGKKSRNENQPKTAKQELSELIRQKPLSIDAPVSGNFDESKPLTWEETLAAAGSNPMEQMLQQEEQERQQKLQAKIQEAGCYPEGYPECTCGEIARRRIVQTQKWKEMAAELKIPQGTLAAHWHRKCKPLLAEIRQTLQEE